MTDEHECEKIEILFEKLCYSLDCFENAYLMEDCKYIQKNLNKVFGIHNELTDLIITGNTDDKTTTTIMNAIDAVIHETLSKKAIIDGVRKTRETRRKTNE